MTAFDTAWDLLKEQAEPPRSIEDLRDKWPYFFFPDPNVSRTIRVPYHETGPVDYRINRRTVPRPGPWELSPPEDDYEGPEFGEFEVEYTALPDLEDDYPLYAFRSHFIPDFPMDATRRLHEDSWGEPNNDTPDSWAANWAIVQALLRHIPDLDERLKAGDINIEDYFRVIE